MLTIRWSDAVEATMLIVVIFAAIFPLDLRNDRTVRPIPAATSIWGSQLAFQGMDSRNFKIHIVHRDGFKMPR
jgi:hypothetical protein